MTEIKSDNQVLLELLALEGRRIIDIGSGSGALARFMTGRGARVTGLECGAEQLARARCHQPAGDETYIEGVAQDLPFGDASFDAAVFFYSLHHVPAGSMARALWEARRVIVPGGEIYIAEPLASGSCYQLCAPVDDEAAVRAGACQAIHEAAGGPGFTQQCEITYSTVCHYDSFAAFCQEMICIEPDRRAAIEALQGQLQASFDRLGAADANGMRFDQPVRVNILKKT